MADKKSTIYTFINHDVIPPLRGPETELDIQDRVFTLRVPTGSANFFTDETQILPSGTVGESNKLFVKEKLDEFIATLVKESEHG